jgi:hypothetical protein
MRLASIAKTQKQSKTNMLSNGTDGTIPRAAPYSGVGVANTPTSQYFSARLMRALVLVGSVGSIDVSRSFLLVLRVLLGTVACKHRPVMDRPGPVDACTHCRPIYARLPFSSSAGGGSGAEDVLRLALLFIPSSTGRVAT